MVTYEITFNEKSVVGKYLLYFLKQNKKSVKVKDNSLMSKDEYFAMIDEGIAQYERGECFELKPEDQRKFLGLE